MPTLANPLGLLALLGIPAVLAIHFLQRKAIELPVSTLFLLERTRRDAASGRRLERIIPSVPLWMQLLAILLLAWFLAEPRLQKEGSVQRIAVVLDSSASMGVFKKEGIERLSAVLPGFQGPASAIEFTVIESAPGRPRVYAGESLDELKTALEKWQPLDGLTDPTQALRLARSLVAREGTVIYLTDTPAESLPFGARILAVGEAIANVGFTGVSFSTEEGSLVWKALVRNYSKTPVDRTWSLQTSNGSTEPRSFRLEGGALVTLQSAFPEGAGNVRLVLSPDRFTLDDTLPLVAPQPKKIELFTATSPAFADLTAKLLEALDHAASTNDAATADLAITSYDPLDPVPPKGNSIVFVEDSTRTGAYLKGGIVAEAGPLLDGLNWQSLLVRETIQLERLPSDSVLLWQEKRPLIFLREKPATDKQPATRQLCFNFDLRLSNAENQPAFIVLLHRFAESIRAAKVSPSRLNLETGQPLRITSLPGVPLEATVTDPVGKKLPVPASLMHAPATPGFLTIRQNETTLLDAAVSFADTREADFSACGKSGAVTDASQSGIRRHTQPDPLWRVWIILLITALLVSWRFNTRKTATA
ncbi:BatA and WFA domain-containing protein [Luteolibacter yonseiensis]|uniref:BatA and WFA domain-containing protein n=1 Tax=Luteolibacter yonseiensis TaxID=1144680 RepID=A0A934R2Q3_9BACT|nr:VWA domain-containing protein [Luteolibacter yonseiensis]MBK1817308.1 BatA and WFA domain-containing protein [Luteolibacter yonseiensis]